MRRLSMLAPLALLIAIGCTSWKQCAYEGSGRDAWQRPDAVVAALEIAPGDRVADLGSGSGYFTLRLARAVGPTGRVYAVDIDEDMNQLLRERLAEEGLENVEVILGSVDDPLLPDGEIDLLFSSNTFHHLQSRPEYFRKLQQDLAPDGRVAILDYDGRKGWFVRLLGHYTPKPELLSDLKAAGYRVDQDLDLSDRQSFVIFVRE